MRFVPIDPPGTWLQNEALFDLLRRHEAGSRFLEVGCGAGALSKKLLERGYRGAGVDVSPEALTRARVHLAEHIANGDYALHDAMPDGETFDFAMCMFVIEHIEDDAAFLREIAQRVRPGGLVIVAVPGRRDHWGFEDETVGHLRRYDVADLRDVLVRADLTPRDIWSVAVPIANLLHRLGNRIVARAESETRKRTLDAHAQTLQSGIRDIPWKTTFPAPLRLLLNRVTLWPLFVVQRLFYRTALGVTLVAAAQTASPNPVRP